MVKLEIKTNWECYSQYGNEAIELVAINSNNRPLELFEGDCPPLDADTLSYLIHTIILYKKENHITEYLLNLFPENTNEITIGKKQIKTLLEWCIKLNADDYAPCYVNEWCKKSNSKTIVSLQWALNKFNDEWYDGERHQWIIKKIK